jgi:hypothetical protein
MQTDYKVIGVNDIVELEQQVNYWLSKGWVCQGGVCVTQTLTATVRLYTQALVKNV